MSEPVEYQMRMRPAWVNPHLWSDWEKCSKGSFDDYTKTPKLHDWEYEVRTLYTTPPQRTWVGLTLEEIESEWGLFMSGQGSGYIPDFAKALETKLKEKNT
jgi:hypothetical protein